MISYLALPVKSRQFRLGSPDFGKFVAGEESREIPSTWP
jgi:hypothetical protein